VYSKLEAYVRSTGIATPRATSRTARNRSSKMQLRFVLSRWTRLGVPLGVLACGIVLAFEVRAALVKTLAITVAVGGAYIAVREPWPDYAPEWAEDRPRGEV
jgi:hypothetical protein